MICPICNRDVQISPQVETTCECCKSIIYLNEKLEPSIIKPRVKFSTLNFIYGIISLAIYVTFTIYLINKDVNLILIGSLQISATGLVFLQQYIWYRSYEYKGFFDLIKAFRSSRLKYYDWGSKFFIISLFIIAIAQFGLLIIGLIILIPINGST